MARVHKVNKSNKPHVCERGGHEIPKGDPYLWAKPGFRTRRPRVRCVKHPFRPSELMTGARSAPTAAVEAFEDAAQVGFDTIDDLVAAWDELRDAIEEYHQERETALEAWEHGNSQLEEYVETAATALEEVEDFTPEEWSGNEEPELVNFDDDQAEFEAAYQEWEDEHQQHVQEQTDAALEVAGSLEF